MSSPQPGADVSARVAWAADAAAIAAVQRSAWQQRYGDALDALLAEQGLTEEAHVAAWQSSLSHPPQARNRALVALAHDRVTGFALTGPATDPDADPAVDGEVSEFTVAPDETGQGHGSRLLHAAIDTLRADGFTRALCWLDSTDDALRGFLTEAGWAPDGAARELADQTGASVKQVRLHTDLSEA